MALTAPVELVQITVRHQIPGRMRLGLPFLNEVHGGPHYLEDVLHACPAVQSVTTNAITGSVLVLYDPEQVGPTSDEAGNEDGPRGLSIRLALARADTRGGPEPTGSNVEAGDTFAVRLPADARSRGA